MCSHYEPTYVGSDQRHRVEVGELHVLGQVLGVLSKQLCQLGRATTWNIVLTLSKNTPKPRGARTQQHAAAPQNILDEAEIGTIRRERKGKKLPDSILDQERSG